MVHVLVAILSTITVQAFDRGVVYVLVGYIVYHYCLKFYRGMARIVIIDVTVQPLVD